MTKSPHKDCIEVLFNADQGIAVEVFTRSDSKLPFGVRMIDLDTQSVLPTIRFCPDIGAAKQHAAKLIGY